MRVVCISDTHKSFPEVPDGDLLIHSGDFSFNATLHDVIELNKWFGTLPHTNKILVPGNHDRIFEKDPVLAKATLSNAITLIDEELVINGIKIYGTPWTPVFFNWYFMGSGKTLGKRFGAIPDDTDILVTHGPPHGIMDQVPYFIPQTGEMGVRNCGSIELYNRLQILKVKHHIFGHIHEGYGEQTIKGTHYINASQMDGNYKLTNKPIVFDI